MEGPLLRLKQKFFTVEGKKMIAPFYFVRALYDVMLLLVLIYLTLSWGVCEVCSYPFVCSFYQIQLKMTIDCYIVKNWNFQ